MVMLLIWLLRVVRMLVLVKFFLLLMLVLVLMLRPEGLEVFGLGRPGGSWKSPTNQKNSRTSC